MNMETFELAKHLAAEKEALSRLENYLYNKVINYPICPYRIEGRCKKEQCANQCIKDHCDLNYKLFEDIKNIVKKRKAEVNDMIEKL